MDKTIWVIGDNVLTWKIIEKMVVEKIFGRKWV